MQKQYEPLKIYCPKCNRKLGVWDGRTSTEVIINCYRCYKRIIFHPKTKVVETKEIPQRNTASGKTFY